MPELHLEKDLSRAVDLLKSLQGNPSLPSEKLRALQEVLESDFLRAIANVYQSIYDTVDVPHNNEEAAAIATAKGTVMLQEISVRTGQNRFLNRKTDKMLHN